MLTGGPHHATGLNNSLLHDPTETVFGLHHIHHSHENLDDASVFW